MTDDFSYTDIQLEHVFVEVQGHVAELHARWGLFRKLYRGNEDSQPVLAAVASDMFYLLGRLLQRGTLLLYRQLTDPPRMGKWRNASLEGLLEAVAGLTYKTTEAELMRCLDAARDNAVLREHGNKYIAHLDFDLLAGTTSAPEGIKIEDFDGALNHIREFMNLMSQRFFGGREVDFGEFVNLMSKQGDVLIETLRKGLDTNWTALAPELNGSPPE
jgi:hypothetical protein